MSSDAKTDISQFIEQDDNCSIFTADSRRHSLAIPVVKVDRSKSVDTTSLGAPRKLTLTKMDEIPEVADV
ncbi:unnamed protein product [Heligmosomoides polygyrus]|uniref:Uncharacterized protein n=1 Tax=Heligmosomoides polygyrus TaxID=6339 RepID=A0A183GJY6_HELPZ|nr:unnamed protein product [Heligmosomoides polygyrus]